MPPSPDVAELPLAGPQAAEDPDFEALPQPRRPGKRITLATLTATTVVTLLLAFALRGEAAYALGSGSPTDLGDLGALQPVRAQANSWVRGAGELGTAGAIRYARPLESDSFRLAPITGNPGLWVEIRVPEGMEGPRFVAPSSFVGRLVPISSAGLRYSSLDAWVAEVGGATLPDNAWVLVDDEAPAATRWAMGLFALFVGFAAFNLYGLYRLLRPVKD
jgi:hypothetical protein